jgi:hypothetical protein
MPKKIPKVVAYLSLLHCCMHFAWTNLEVKECVGEWWLRYLELEKFK